MESRRCVEAKSNSSSDEDITSHANSENSVLTSQLMSVPINNLNFISALPSESSRILPQLEDRSIILQSNRVMQQSSITDDDQVVPTMYTSSVLQSMLKINNEGLIKSVTGHEYMNLAISKLSSSEGNKSRNIDQIDSLNKEYLTSDCDDLMSPDLLPLFLVKRTKTVVEESFAVCTSRDGPLYKLKINKDINFSELNDIENLTGVISTETKTSNFISVVSKPILKNEAHKVNDFKCRNLLEIPNSSWSDVNQIRGEDIILAETPLSKEVEVDIAEVQTSNKVNTDCDFEADNTINCCNKEAKQSNSLECHDLLEISNSSWSDIDQIRENLIVAEKTLTKDIEEVHSSNRVNTDCDEELDSIIDQSITKYEYFSKDVSVSAIPITAEKSCQTDIIDEGRNLVGCKRRLDFIDKLTEPIEKKNKADLVFQTMSNVLRNRNDSSTQCQSINEHFDPPVNAGLRFPTIYSPRSDEVDQLDEESLFSDVERDEGHHELLLPNESSFDSDQEVPIILQKNKGPLPRPSFITPKKPVLRVGLSRSARFKPLHTKE